MVFLVFHAENDTYAAIDDFSDFHIFFQNFQKFNFGSLGYDSNENFQVLQKQHYPFLYGTGAVWVWIQI